MAIESSEQLQRLLEIINHSPKLVQLILDKAIDEKFAEAFIVDKKAEEEEAEESKAMWEEMNPYPNVKRVCGICNAETTGYPCSNCENYDS